VPVLVLGIAIVQSAGAAPRTFVASNGNDAAPCAFEAPCRSFAAALQQTDGRGEIVALDSAGYGQLTIDRSVTIRAPEGVYAGITASITGPGDHDGISIAAAGAVVVLQGLTIASDRGRHGIVLDQGASLSIERCVVSGFGTAVGVYLLAPNATVSIKDSTIRANHDGIIALGIARLALERVVVEQNVADGIYVSNGTRATIARTAIRGNSRGLVVQDDGPSSHTEAALMDVAIDGNAGAGLSVETFDPTGVLRVFATRTSITGNALYGVYVHGHDSGGKALIAMTSSSIADNGTGLFAAAGLAPGDVTVSLTDVAIARNTGFGIVQTGAARIYSRQNNTVQGNNGGGAQLSGTLTPIAPM
jgi:hypothetical protein